MKNNLIGISGHMGSGKDTVGKILQYLSAGNELSKITPNLVADWEYNWHAGTKMGTYKIKKFSDKLKDIVCLLIGCTKEQLEDREFKKKELGEEWNIWVLVPNPDYNLFDGNCELEERIFSSSDEVKKYIEEYKIINVLDIEERALTPRKLLQLLGTQAGRDIIHPNIWINSLFADYNQPIDKKQKINKDKGYAYKGKISNWIITDVRFLNEVKYIKDKGGIVIRVNRDLWKPKPGDVIKIKVFSNWSTATYTHTDKKGNHFAIGSDGYKYKSTLIKEFKDDHYSETALDDYENFNYIIDNNGDIEELIEKVKQLKLV